MKRRRYIQTTALAGLAVGLGACYGKSKTHILTLSFDDGFKKSFYKTAEIYEEYGLKACLNIIASGHLQSFKTDPQWMPQKILGDFNDWNLLKNRGHEIMPHSWEHVNLTEIPIDQAKENIDKCLDYFEKELEGFETSDAVYNFAYNASTPELEDYLLKRVRAVRTGGWLVLKDSKVNLLPVSPKPVRLGCWSKGPDLCDNYVEEEVNSFLSGPGGWLILNLHGLDDEGWGPISTNYLDKLLKRLAIINYLEILPAGEVLRLSD